MTEQQQQHQGVTVKISGTMSKNYPNGADLRVQDGHLFVLDGHASSMAGAVAVFAPGHWQSAAVHR